MVSIFVKVNGFEVQPYNTNSRRIGNITTCYCDIAKIELRCDI